MILVLADEGQQGNVRSKKRLRQKGLWSRIDQDVES